MADYSFDEPENTWNPDDLKLNRAVDRLKEVRQKLSDELELKMLDGTPTSADLEQMFSGRITND